MHTPLVLQVFTFEDACLMFHLNNFSKYRTDTPSDSTLIIIIILSHELIARFSWRNNAAIPFRIFGVLIQHLGFGIWPGMNSLFVRQPMQEA